MQTDNRGTKVGAAAGNCNSIIITTSSKTITKPLVTGGKILAFESGGDWADASVEYMVNISGKSGDEIFEEYKKNGGYHGNGKTWFKQWTIDKGYCREETDDEIEVVSDL